MASVATLWTQHHRVITGTVSGLVDQAALMNQFQTMGLHAPTREWVMDTCASSHFASDPGMLTSVSPPTPLDVQSLSVTAPPFRSPVSGMHIFLFPLRPRLPFSSTNHVTTTPFQIIHCDLWTSAVESISGFKYYLVCLDDFT
jgi:hypothetical protein